jgi:hypothetical protein
MNNYVIEFLKTPCTLPSVQKVFKLSIAGHFLVPDRKFVTRIDSLWILFNVDEHSWVSPEKVLYYSPILHLFLAKNVNQPLSKNQSKKKFGSFLQCKLLRTKNHRHFKLMIRNVSGFSGSPRNRKLVLNTFSQLPHVTVEGQNVELVRKQYYVPTKDDAQPFKLMSHGESIVGSLDCAPSGMHNLTITLIEVVAGEDPVEVTHIRPPDLSIFQTVSRFPEQNHTIEPEEN